MRGMIAIIGVGILITISTLIIYMCVPGSRSVMVIGCLILMFLWLALLVVTCVKGRRWKRDSALLEEITRQEMKKQENEKDSEIRSMKEDVAWLKRQIAHGVRMPLAIISGYGDLLRRGDWKTPEEQDLYIDKICKNIEYLNRTFQIVIDDEAGKDVEDDATIDLLQVVGDVVEYADHITKSHGIQLELNSSCTQVYIQGNRIDIMKALYNLIENSLKYMRHGDAIYITVEAVEGQAWIVYRDNGEGVTKREAERITEADYRGEDAGERLSGIRGSGMGMYLVDDIIKHHHGTIQIKGGTGNGFAVYITLPLAEE
nr:MAG TPA: Signal transduction histidine kinase [Caudoviricetes sp.]